MNSAYGFDVGQAAPVAGIERTPSLVLLVAEIVRLFAWYTFDVCRADAFSALQPQVSCKWLDMRRPTKSLVGCRFAYY